jgi:hypothetical protein
MKLTRKLRRELGELDRGARPEKKAEANWGRADRIPGRRFFASAKSRFTLQRSNRRMSAKTGV